MVKMRWLYKTGLTVVVVCAVFASMTGRVAAAKLEIFVRDKVMVDGSVIRLGDIADFRPHTDLRVAKLARIRIAPSPPPGRSARLSHELLIYKLASFLANDKDVRVKVPQSLYIRRTASVVSKERLEKIFRNYVKEHSPWPSSAVKINAFNGPSKVVLPKGKLRWTVRHMGKTHFVGPLSLTVTFWVNDKPVTKVPLSGDLFVKQPFLKLRKKCSRGYVLKASDIVVVEKLSDSFNDMFLRDPRQAVGKQLVRTVLKGQLLSRAMVREMPLVKKGQQIKILAENEHIKVTTLGRALQDGRAGDQIKVVNINSGKEILATVKGPAMVVVQF